MVIISRCIINGCTIQNARITAGMCSMHCQRKIKGIDPYKPVKGEKRECILTGDTLKVPVYTNKKIVYYIVDADMFNEVSKYNWYSNTDGYATTNLPRQGSIQRSLKLHRLVIGEIPEGMVTDHINGDKRNNCRSNLRITTQHRNIMNARAWGESKYKGVSKDVEKKTK